MSCRPQAGLTNKTLTPRNSAMPRGNPLFLGFLIASLAAGWSLPPAVRAADPNVRGAVAGDPAKMLGADSCIKCHRGEMEVWQKHPHFKTFEELHRQPEAKSIADRMGEK